MASGLLLRATTASVISTGRLLLQPTRPIVSLMAPFVQLTPRVEPILTFKPLPAAAAIKSFPPAMKVLAPMKPILGGIKYSSPIDVVRNPLIIPLLFPPAPILPSFSRNISQLIKSDERLSGKLNRPQQRFIAFEQLAGISQQRPEMLLATNFRPLYLDAHGQSNQTPERKTGGFVPGLNQYGNYVDAQIQLNHLKHESIAKLIKDLKKNSEDFKQLAESQDQQFHYHIEILKGHANYLRDTLHSLDNLKNVFDLRKDVFKVDVAAITFDHFSFQDTQQRLISNLEEEFPSELTYKGVLGELGFLPKNVDSWSSTKIFLQTLYEFNNVLKGYTNKLLSVDTLEQHDDENPTFINKHTIKNFKLDLSDTVRFQFLENLRQADALGVVIQVKDKFDALFSNVHFSDDESKMAMLTHFLAKELNYSNALKNADFRLYLKNTYGYDISNTLSNEGMFDVFLGNIGTKITDQVSLLSPNSLSALSQQAHKTDDGADISVLPFETTYIEYENGTYTPGSVFLIDKVLDLVVNDKNVSSEAKQLDSGKFVDAVVGSEMKFNTANLEEFAGIASQHIDRLTNVANKLNFLPQFYLPTDGQYSTIMGHSTKFFLDILGGFLNLNNHTLKSNMDSDVAAIFNKAANDSRLKSLLFLYVFARTFGAKNATSVQVLNVLVKEIVKTVGGSLANDDRPIREIFNNKMLGAKILFSAKPVDSMEHILKTSNDFLSTFFNQFTRIFNTFKSSSNVGGENSTDLFTGYSHVQNTTLLMVIFEMLLTVVNKYVHKKIIGRVPSLGLGAFNREHYTTQVKFESNSVSIQTVRSKLAFENNIRVKLMYLLLSTLGKVKDGSRNLIQEISKPKQLEHLQSVLEILEDKSLLEMVMNEQQIHLIESTVDDVIGKVAENIPTTGIAAGGDADSPSEVEDVQIALGNNKDDLKIIDDSLINTNLRHALFAMFSSERFSSVKAENMRILTVGIPLGFSNELRKSVNVKKLDPKSFQVKQNDVIKLNVYKVDVEYQDLIFKPQTFLFELNRYVVKNDRVYRSLSAIASENEILDSIPTRDYSFLEGTLQSRVTFLSDKDAAIFTSTEYDFLSSQEKKEILRNHVRSYLFELYVRLLTGMRISERDFLVKGTDPSRVKVRQDISGELFRWYVNDGYGLGSATHEEAMASLQQTTNNFPLFEGARVKSYVPEPTMRMGDYVYLTQGRVMLSEFQRMRSTYVDDLNESKNIFTPKTFERIFNVPVDPDDFEIDMSETVKTTTGKELIAKLLKQQRIVAVDEASSFYPSAYDKTKSYKLVNRDVNVGDLVFEKYFVNAQTVLETEV